jgi:hypothetical protein
MALTGEAQHRVKTLTWNEVEAVVQSLLGSDPQDAVQAAAKQRALRKLEDADMVIVTYQP